MLIGSGQKLPKVKPNTKNRKVEISNYFHMYFISYMEHINDVIVEYIYIYIIFPNEHIATSLTLILNAFH